MKEIERKHMGTVEACKFLLEKREIDISPDDLLLLARRGKVRAKKRRRERKRLWVFTKKDLESAVFPARYCGGH